MHQLIGIDIGGTQIKMGAFSADGNMLTHRISETGDRPTAGAPAFAETVRRMLREADASGNVCGHSCAGRRGKRRTLDSLSAGKDARNRRV